MIDYFTATDLSDAHPAETLPQWLARTMGITQGEARARLAAMQEARAAMVNEHPAERAKGRAAA